MNYKVQFISFLCACLVPTIHLTTVGPMDFIAYTPSWFVYSIIFHGLAMIAVPFFFIVSGYFLARHDIDKFWGHGHRMEILKRCYSLLVPVVIWGGAWWCFRYRCGANLLACLCLNLTLPAYEPLWFLRALFLFVLVAPLFVILSRNILVMGIWFACAVIYPIFVTDDFTFQFIRYFFSPLGAFYFAVGIALQRNRYRMALSRRTSGIIFSLGILVLSLKFMSVKVPHYATVISYSATPFLLIGIWGLVSEVKLPAKLVGCSMLVYLVHEFVVVLYYAVVTRFRLGNANCYHYCFAAMFVVLASVLFAMSMRTFFPRVSRVLTGGR